MVVICTLTLLPSMGEVKENFGHCQFLDGWSSTNGCYNHISMCEYYRFLEQVLKGAGPVWGEKSFIYWNYLRTNLEGG